MDSSLLYQDAFQHSPLGIVISRFPDRKIVELNAAFARLSGYPAEELVGRTSLEAGICVDPDAYNRIIEESARQEPRGEHEIRYRTKQGEIRHGLVSFDLVERGGGQYLVTFLRDVTAQKQTEADMLRRAKEIEAVNRISAALRLADSLDETMAAFLEESLSAVDAQAGAVLLYDPASGRLAAGAAQGWLDTLGKTGLQVGPGILNEILMTQQPVIIEDIAGDVRLHRSAGPGFPPGWNGIFFPILTGQELVGLLFIALEDPRWMSQAEALMVRNLAEIAGNAIRGGRLLEQTHRERQRLGALHDIDKAIASSMDLKLTLDVILAHVQKELNVDAAAVLLTNPGTNDLEYVAQRGYRSRRISHIQIRPGTGLAGRALESRDLVYSMDISLVSEPENLVRLFHDEEFVTGCAAVVSSKGQPVGALEVYSRTRVQPDEEWFGFLESLSGQVAIAVESVRMLENLHRTNIELVMAYDTTIEALSQAMDLRDRDTEGHSLRVAELTQNLARRMGLPESSLVNIRRGALLHDLGKIGIPDSILSKKGPLNDEEWVIMRKHTEYAQDMLSKIEFLRPALDIPCYHHEKWDGTGYPLGLKGEQIPLAARLFAVVDVWDALSSDRPYRPAWPEQKVLDYIRSQSGTHFDPRVVDAFMGFIQQPKR